MRTSGVGLVMVIPPGGREETLFASRTAPSVLLADDWLFISHGDRTGRPRLSKVVSGLGLAGALLAEAVLAGAVAIDSGTGVWPWQRLAGHPTGFAHRDDSNRVAAVVADQIHHEPEVLPVRVWLEWYADQQRAYRLIGERLAERGQVRVQQRRRGVRYRPVDMSGAQWRVIRICRLIRDGKVTEPTDAVLIGLCAATGLADWVGRAAFPVSCEQAWAVLQSVGDLLPEPIWVLLAQVEIAVGAAVMAHRR